MGEYFEATVFTWKICDLKGIEKIQSESFGKLLKITCCEILIMFEFISVLLQGSTVNPHSFIVFTDDDTAAANSEINFLLLNDKANIFEEDCKRVESNHKLGEQSTVFYCSKFWSLF